MPVTCYRDEPVVLSPELFERGLHFGAGIPGFAALHRFAVAPYGGAESPFVLLTAAEDNAVRFVVVPPEIFFPDYVASITSEALGSIGLDDPSTAVVWVVLTIPAPPAIPTANLLGPLVVNPDSGAAIQAVQVRGEWDPATPFPLA